MPTYDYECQACGHKFEEFQSIKAEPIKVCPACKKNKVRRIIGSGGGLIFKGTGFYCTDYRDGGKSSSSDSSTKSS
jgi:putative FmdB family regulatory protein